MAKRELPDPELLRKLLRYEPETGKLYWRERPREMFKTAGAWKAWNTKFAGARAFATVNSFGYCVGGLSGRMHKAHRIIWAIVHGGHPIEYIDHINGNRTDNRIQNLRSVSCAENNRNSSLPRDNSSGVIGVYWHRQKNRWHAQIRINGGTKHIGYFKSLNAAAEARARAEAKYSYHPNHGRHS